MFYLLTQWTSCLILINITFKENWAENLLSGTAGVVNSRCALFLIASLIQKSPSDGGFFVPLLIIPNLFRTSVI